MLRMSRRSLLYSSIHLNVMLTHRNQFCHKNAPSVDAHAAAVSPPRRPRACLCAGESSCAAKCSIKSCRSFCGLWSQAAVVLLPTIVNVISHHSHEHDRITTPTVSHMCDPLSPTPLEMIHHLQGGGWTPPQDDPPPVGGGPDPPPKMIHHCGGVVSGELS